MRAFLPFLAMLLPALVPLGAAGHSYTLEDVAVGHLWAPPPEDGATTLDVYGPILNRGAVPARLAGVSTPVAESAGFADSDGASLADLALPPGKPVTLAAWSHHIRLSGLRRPLEAGDRIPMTLDFGGAGRLDIEVVVERNGSH